MRGSLALLRKPSSSGSSIGSPTISNPFISYSAFSTSSSGGSGRGRFGGTTSHFNFTAPTEPEISDSSHGSDNSGQPTLPSIGRGRGKPIIPASPFLPSLNNFVAPNSPSHQPNLGQGRGGPNHSPPESGTQQDVKPKRPIFFLRDDEVGGVSESKVTPKPRRPIGESNLPDSLLSVLMSSGRGKPVKKPHPEEVYEENRHLRARGSGIGVRGRGRERDDVRVEVGERPKLSHEEATRKAVSILSRGGGQDREGGGRGRGMGRGRGRGRGVMDRGRGRGRGRWREDRIRDSEEDLGTGLYLGDDADGEKLANMVGPEIMNELTEAFEEMSGTVLPSTMEDEYLEALATNMKIELEPEYLMEFNTNPDIDEKPPIPLREALENMKPFLMAYEGIQSQEEWEEIMKETMERVPLLKEIVDYYSGPDTVTAKQQQEELERVANTLPASAPDSVKRFTNRAVLSLQSNPGWGFNRKCQFMDKLVAEVSQFYKS
ncbi:hypothetical protein Ancab_002511 [Ancistrocladus abbreviatus]